MSVTRSERHKCKQVNLDKTLQNMAYKYRKDNEKEALKNSVLKEEKI